MIYLGKIIKKYKVKKILDYGCGIGTLSQFIHVTFPELVIHGFDISSKSIKDIPEELKNIRITLRVNIIPYRMIMI